MNKKLVVMTSFVTVLSLILFKVTVANESKTESIANGEIKSLAYYVANMKEARSMNQECYDKGLDRQAIPNCANALHALEISHVGGDKISGYKYQH